MMRRVVNEKNDSRMYGMDELLEMLLVLGEFAELASKDNLGSAALHGLSLHLYIAYMPK